MQPTLRGKAATSPIANMLGILVLNMESTCPKVAFYFKDGKENQT
jgi:hypothetical protein